MMTEDGADVVEQGGGDGARDTRDVLASLAKEGVCALARSVRAQLAIEAGVFPSGPEQRGDDGREREHQQQSVASRRLLDAHVSEAEAEAPVLVVSEGLLDGKSLGVQ